MSDERLETIVGSVIAGEQGPAPSGRRVRRRIVIGGACVIVAAGGAVAAAALSSSGQPTRPEVAALCLSAASLDAPHRIGLDLAGDPIDACRAAWQAGRFNDDVALAPQDVPPLTACIGSEGSLFVFPGDLSVCEELGLGAADPVLNEDNVRIVALQERLVNEVNLAVDCLTGSEAVDAAKRIVAESGLKGWQVTVNPGAETAVCAKTLVDTPTRTVSVLEF